MRDSPREPGANPKRNAPRPASGRPSIRDPQTELNGRSRPPSPRPGMAGPGQAPRARMPLSPEDPLSKRPKLPFAEETLEAHFERTERLRALRQDFLDHAQTKVSPQKPRNVWLAVALTSAMLVLCIVGLVAFFQLRSTLFAPGGQQVVTQFMDALKSQNYSDAYGACASNAQELFNDRTLPLPKQSTFIQQAQDADKNGKITNYVQANANSIDSNNEQYMFTVTRTNQGANTTTNVALVVTKQDDGSWKISSIDGNLLPPAPQPPEPTPTPITGSAAKTTPSLSPLDQRNNLTLAQSLRLP